MTTFTWLGHGSIALTVSGMHIVVDPFLDDNPAATSKAEAVAADYILISHAHEDHTADVESIARRTGATIISNYEIAGYYQNKGLKAHGQQPGGGYQHPFGYLKLTPAIHGSGFADGSYGGLASGFLLATPEGKKVYLACDTALFGDMALIGDEGLDFATLPIGDNFTMGPDDALKAVKLLRPARVVPLHFSTWDVIKQDGNDWVERVKQETQAVAELLQPGESVEI